MTAAVANARNPLSMNSDASAQARRRRMDILHKGPEPSPGVLVATAAGPPKKRKVLTGSEPDEDSSARRTAKMAKKTKTTTTAAPAASAKSTKSGTATKKPQNRYEPEVPMTKEEAAAWRREQRRQRNRESAAASRQRQRERIVELEKEVDEWKTKFSAVMDRLRVLEEAREAGAGGPMPSSSDLNSSKLLVGVSTDATNTTNGFTAPTDEEIIMPPSTIPSSTPVDEGLDGGSEKKQHLIETISRPAVKITGDASSSSAFYLPDAVTSTLMTKEGLDFPATPTSGADVAAPFHPAIVAASPAVPDECFSTLPPPNNEETTTKGVASVSPVSPTGADEPLAAHIVDAIDLPDSSVIDLPFLSANPDDELGDFLVDWL